MAVEVLLESSFFVPPDGFFEEREEGDIADASANFGREGWWAKVTFFEELRGGYNGGDLAEVFFEQGEGFFEVRGVDVEEEIASGASGGEKLTFGIGTHQGAEFFKDGVLIEIDGGLGGDGGLSVIGGEEEEGIMGLFAAGVEEEAFDLCEDSIDLRFDLGRFGAVLVADRVDIGVIEGEVGGGGDLIEIEAKVGESFGEGTDGKTACAACHARGKGRIDVGVGNISVRSYAIGLEGHKEAVIGVDDIGFDFFFGEGFFALCACAGEDQGADEGIEGGFIVLPFKDPALAGGESGVKGGHVCSGCGGELGGEFVDLAMIADLS